MRRAKNPAPTALALLFAAAPVVASLVAVAPARAYLAVSVFRSVLETAGPDVRRCVETQALPEGRYVVRVVVAATGKPESVELTDAPAVLSSAATECLVAAFARLRFTPLGPPPAPPPSVWVHGRHVRVPGPSSRDAPRVTISWPFVVQHAPLP